MSIELLTPEERADLLNKIVDLLDGTDLQVFGYDDSDGVFFTVLIGEDELKIAVAEGEDVPTASPITPDQFRDKMYEIVEEQRGYPETMHIEMDELMCEMLKSLGYEGGVRIFEKQKKWYS